MERLGATSVKKLLGRSLGKHRRATLRLLPWVARLPSVPEIPRGREEEEGRMCRGRLIAVTAGPVTLKVVGTSAAAISAATVMVGFGAAAAIMFVGYGLGHLACQGKDRSIPFKRAERQALPNQRGRKHLT